MTFTEFTQLLLSRERPVVLLEGRRKLPSEHRARLTALGGKLAGRFPHAVFRSGNAAGADEAFAEGVCRVAPERMELVLPRKTMGKARAHPAAHVRSLEEVSVATEETALYLGRRVSPGHAALFEKGHVRQLNPRMAATARYLLRDAVKVTGDESLGLAQATAGLFYINPADPLAGGTGFTNHICRQRQVPVVTQDDWWRWLSE